MILIGGGGAFVLLVFMALFVAVPVMLLRAATRRIAAPMEPYEPYDAYGPAAAWETPDLEEVSTADVVSLRDRLGHDVRTLEPGKDAASRQAMADAAERYSTSGTLLERATSPAQLRTSWLAVVEGLAATRSVRNRLGLDPGPALPTLPTSGPQLSGSTPVNVDGQTVSGAPTYEPGRPYWFPGGRHDGRPVPGGWYDVPFWPAALLGGLGGWALGGLAADALGAGDGAGDDGWGSNGSEGGGFGGGSGWDSGAGSDW